MCFVNNEQAFTQVLNGFLSQKKSFTSLDVKLKLQKDFPNDEWEQRNIGNELRSRFNRGEFGKFVAKIERVPVVFVRYCLPSSKELRK